ncbi:MAG: nitroreductase family protein [Jatrophihabitans sp.]
MELSVAIRNRRSTAPVTDLAPDDAQLAGYLQLAAHSPDHAGLRPWRLITVRDTARHRLGEALATGFGDQPGSPAAARTASKTQRAPLLITVVGVPIQHPKVPDWEQLAAVGALVATLQLVLYEAGYTAMWRTGPAVGLPAVRELLGLAERELLLGWLYVGGTRFPGGAGQAGQVDGPEPDVGGRISSLAG